MSKRKVFHIEGLGHGANPIPLAVQIGSVLYSGSIDGRVPQTGKFAETPEAQIGQAFANVQTLLGLAGGTLADLGKVDVRLADMAHRTALNAVWLELFPDAEDRPVRHTSQAALTAPLAIQIEITAHV